MGQQTILLPLLLAALKLHCYMVPASAVRQETDPYDVAALLDLWAGLEDQNILNWEPGTDPCGHLFCHLQEGRRPLLLPQDPALFPPCNWEGVECQAWRVTSLDLSCPSSMMTGGICQHPLKGGLPDSLGNMSFLINLDVSNNAFSGQLPGTFDRMDRLLRIAITKNLFTGPLPPSIGRVASLRILSAANNGLEGGLPEGWAFLRSLQHINLDNNRLTGGLPPAWVSLSNLQSLSLVGNDLSGEVPTSWTHLLSLRDLRLAANCQLCGKVPRMHMDEVYTDFRDTNIGLPCHHVDCTSSTKAVVSIVLPAVVVGCIVSLILVLGVVLHVLLRIRRRRRLQESAQLAAAAAALADLEAAAGAGGGASSGAGGEGGGNPRVGKWREYAKLVVQPDWTVAFGVMLAPSPETLEAEGEALEAAEGKAQQARAAAAAGGPAPPGTPFAIEGSEPFTAAAQAMPSSSASSSIPSPAASGGNSGVDSSGSGALGDSGTAFGDSAGMALEDSGTPEPHTPTYYAEGSRDAHLAATLPPIGSDGAAVLPVLPELDADDVEEEGSGAGGSVSSLPVEVVLTPRRSSRRLLAPLLELLRTPSNRLRLRGDCAADRAANSTSGAPWRQPSTDANQQLQHPALELTPPVLQLPRGSTSTSHALATAAGEEAALAGEAARQGSSSLEPRQPLPQEVEAAEAAGGVGGGAQAASDQVCSSSRQETESGLRDASPRQEGGDVVSPRQEGGDAGALHLGRRSEEDEEQPPVGDCA